MRDEILVSHCIGTLPWISVAKAAIIFAFG